MAEGMKTLWIAAPVAGIAAVGIASLSLNLPPTVEAQAAPQAVVPIQAAAEPRVTPMEAPAEPVPLQRADANACVAASWESRYRNLAYDHVVTLNNGCDASVECEIMTLDEASVFVTLLSRTTKEITFRKGAEERDLRAWMQCTR